MESKLRVWISLRATFELKALLEQKHLYQRNKIEVPEEVARLAAEERNEFVRDKFIRWAATDLSNEAFSLTRSPDYTTQDYKSLLAMWG
jgi:hypothetical protein